MMSTRYDEDRYPSVSSSPAAILNRLGRCSDAEMSSLVHDLMLTRRLAPVVQALNGRLDDHASRDEALRLLSRIGLSHGG